VTEPERRELRELINAAQRARLGVGVRRRYDGAPVSDGERCCAYCGEVLGPVKPSNAARQRFCSPTHRANFNRREWRRREAARVREAIVEVTASVLPSGRCTPEAA
jgi:hypothetical protein